MENHHFQWENPLFLWPFSIAMLVHQRVLIPQQNAIFTTGFRADFRTHPATMMDDPPRDDPPSSAAQN